MKIQKSTARYEEWLGKQLTIVPADLTYKHAQMSAAIFPFMRATYYRWAQVWPEVCGDLASAPRCWRWAICTWRISGRGAISKGA